ncbi:MAG: redoxin domain-containing protein [Phycisphaeraceae bacterium]|nr:redoxin domain-containing protein [Phycisphaeraceae bacterium]
MLNRIATTVAALALLSAAAFALPRPGDPAPPLTLKEITNAPADAPRTLEELRGKVVVLEFWATWCGPCVAAIPHLNEIHDQFAERDDVVFLAVTDEPPETTRQFLEHRSMKFPIAHDDNGATFRAYGVRAIPRTIIINQSGVVAGVVHPKSLTRETLRGYIEGQMDAFDFETAERKDLAVAYEDLARNAKDFIAGSDPLSAAPRHRPEFQIIVRKNPYSPGGGIDSGDAFSLTRLTPRAVLARVSGLRPGQIEFPPNHPSTEDVYDLVVRWPTESPAFSLRIAAANLAAQGMGYDASLVETETKVWRLIRSENAKVDLNKAPQNRGYRHSPTEFAAEDGAPIGSLVTTLEQAMGRVVLDHTALDGAFVLPAIRFDPGSIESVNAALRDTYGLELIESTRVQQVLRLTLLPN